MAQGCRAVPLTSAVYLWLMSDPDSPNGCDRVFMGFGGFDRSLQHLVSSSACCCLFFGLGILEVPPVSHGTDPREDSSMSSFPEDVYTSVSQGCAAESQREGRLRWLLEPERCSTLQNATYC